MKFISILAMETPEHEPTISEGAVIAVLLGIGVVMTLALIGFFAYVLTRKDE